NSSNPNNIIYKGEAGTYYVKGGIRDELDSLKVTLVVATESSLKKGRSKLDLYEDRQTEKFARMVADKLGLRADQIESDIAALTDLLETYRQEHTESSVVVKPSYELTGLEKRACETFLKAPNLMKRINEKIGESGVVGEDRARQFLFVIASTYKIAKPLHALIQGSSGSGKTHLLSSILELMPNEDTISLTRITESSLYNYDKYELSGKLIGIEDWDGLHENAELAFRELQSKGMIASSTTIKNELLGKMSAAVKEVCGPIASLSATTKGEIYEDNMSRCFLLAVDESREQTLRIIAYQNELAAGKIDRSKSKRAKQLLANCMRVLKPLEVINPYAGMIELPSNASKLRRLNEQFQGFTRQVSLLHSYQRKRDVYGRVITELADIEIAVEILFESIVLKVDELDGALRAYYESLKKYVRSKGKDYAFSRLEIRQQLGVSKTRQHYYMGELLALEYITTQSGYSNRGYKYGIVYWDDNTKLRAELRENLERQIAKIREGGTPQNTSGTPE
ncbi:hypothetical protein N8482_03155, partial [Chitinophagales bacterium]|nr:hypothetical protein [Chitinophagales bacterium]